MDTVSNESFIGCFFVQGLHLLTDPGSKIVFITSTSLILSEVNIKTVRLTNFSWTKLIEATSKHLCICQWRETLIKLIGYLF